jgi:Ran GTPase-activating protein (RanGAP) involved in mRNA processing and transport
VRSNTTLQQLNLGRYRLDDQGISVLANALAIRYGVLLKLDIHDNQITPVGVLALADDNAEAVKTLTEFCLLENPIKSQGAIILADALGRNTMPSLKRIDLGDCDIDDDGFVALVSTLEQNTSLEILNLRGNDFGGRGYMALAESLPNIKGLQQINVRVCGAFQSTTLSLLMECFRKNTSLVKVVISACARGDCLKEVKFWVSETDSLLC